MKNYNKNLNKIIEVKKSSILGAGLGAFAKVKISKGQRIGEYNGTLLNQIEYEALQDKTYVFELAKKYQGRYYLFYVDAKSGDLLKYVNGASSKEEKTKINVEAYQYAEKIFFRSTRIIYPQEELLIDYGDNYWQ